LLLSIRIGIERRQATLVQTSPSTYLTKSLSEADSNQQFYNFKVDYPCFQPEGDKCLSEINAIVYGLVLSYVSDVRQSDSLNVDRRDSVKQRGWDWTQDSLYIPFDVYLLTASFISIAFMVSLNEVGAAHPMHHTRVLKLQRNPVRLVSTDHLFSASSGFLRVLSEYCFADLVSRLQKTDWPLNETLVEWMKRGTSDPYLSNY
jgi:hypothetical protein